ESGMSHVYSFFLVSALLRLSQRLHRRGRLDLGMGLALGAVAGLLVITRFTNALLLVIPLLWEVRSAAELKTRFRVLLTGRGWLVLPLVPLVLISLQMGYYFYLSGSPFHYAYASEGFDFGHPALLETWFSPHNGLFLYAPMMVFALVGLGRMAERKIAGAWLGIGLFVVTSYVFASWWQWYFGCALGARSFVEYYPIYMVAFGYFLQWLGTKAAPWRVGTWTVMVLLAILSFKNGYLYKLCYLGEGDWDWNWFLGLVGAV
ncbi:MAG TPA: hypothetical protein VHS96_03515, partial [Bacteroidia bacterium]|nr:hypothetical protein [Bacteroidia bacterium]